MTVERGGGRKKEGEKEREEEGGRKKERGREKERGKYPKKGKKYNSQGLTFFCIITSDKFVEAPRND